MYKQDFYVKALKSFVLKANFNAFMKRQIVNITPLYNAP